jgi:hypothetical protein
MILAIVFVSFMIQNAGADDAAPLIVYTILRMPEQLLPLRRLRCMAE